MGRGRFSVFLAKQGARITGIDIAPRLMEAASLLARINEVGCDFQRANIVDLPMETNQFDTVVGNMVLHHLSQPDLLKAFEEIRRVLKPDGLAIFVEPVENSRLFDLLQNLIPAGKRNTPYHRPSILQGEAWQRYVAAMEDRNLTNQELIAAGQPHFSSVQLTPYGFTIRLEKIFGRRFRGVFNAVDQGLFRLIPPLKHLSQTVLVVYRQAAP